MVADPKTLEPTPHDGQTIGEIFMRGNTVMKGYLKNPTATAEAFEGGWFHTGDLAVTHPTATWKSGPAQGHHHFRRREHLHHRTRRRAVPPPGRPRSRRGRTPR
jgi:acyl-CoA synthetase (AMP-forming)/AMP-acid ligase II